jgi:serine/threonine-protein kinase
MDRLTGRTIGPYALEELLGRGGMGAVYRGVHETMGRPTAVKVLLPTGEDSAIALRRFLREATYAGHLDHPNIVTMYDAADVMIIDPENL